MNPNMGTFLSLDPFEGVTANSRSLNRYSYVWGNPVNRADASGMCSQATIEAGRQAGLVLRSGTELANASVDGAIPGLVAAMFCAAEDFGTYRNTAIIGSGFTVEIAAMYVAGAAGVATGSVVLAIAGLGILVGVSLVAGLVLFPPITYTPDDLEDMRPPMPPVSDFTPTPGASNPQPISTPMPQTTPLPLPVPQPDRVSDPTRVNDPCRDDENGCDPVAFRHWWNLQPPSTIGPSGNVAADAYEARVARGAGTMGTTKEVPTLISNVSDRSIFTMNVDGAESSTCHLIEAKYASNVQNPAWQTDGYYRILNQADWEISRLSSIVHNPATPAEGVEIRTNSPVAQDYFRTRLPVYALIEGIDGFVNLVP